MTATETVEEKWPEPVVMYAFAFPGRIDWAAHLFDTEEKARTFGGSWAGKIITVEVRALVRHTAAGTIIVQP
jgi:hypothetical protein